MKKFVHHFLKFYLLIFLVPLLSPTSLFAAETLNCPAFSRNLMLGVEGDDVRALQILLNKDTWTQISQTGVGAPGQETGYFGQKTKDAVVRFQNRYVAEVLNPAGLFSGNGFVGAYSRIKLLKLCNTELSKTEKPIAKPQLKKATTTAFVPIKTALQTANNQFFATSTTQNFSDFLSKSTSTATSLFPYVPITPNMKIPAGMNPNMVNYEFAMDVLRKNDKKNAVSEQKTEEKIAAIREILATTTDLHKEFFSKMKFKVTNGGAPPALGGPTEVTLTSMMHDLLSFVGFEKVANAQVGVPFGGLIVFTFPCPCDGGLVWNVEIIGTGPTYADILDVVPGAQLYANYNTPLPGIYVLGFYEPGIESCWVGIVPYCIFVPSWGLITPFLGSSLL